MCSGIDEFRTPVIIHIILYHENMRNYITHYISFTLHKTRS